MDALNIQLSIAGGGDKYPAKAHVRRVVEKLNVSEGIILLSGQNQRNWPNSDMPAPFRQDRYFYYLSGCSEADTFVTYDIGKDKLELWLPPINKERVVWYGRGSTIDEAMEKYDIDAAHYIKARRDGRPSVENLSDLWNQQRGTCELSRPLPIDAKALRHAIDACRVIKDDHEIALIKRANAITAEAHVSVMRGMHAFVNEADVEAAYMQVCIARKAKTQAYDPIAGAGKNAAELHYSDNTAAFKDGPTVVLDAGCEVELYASDVTRTLPINVQAPGHWPSRESENIYRLVESIQEKCIQQMLPGKQFIEIFWYAHQLLIEGLLELGILVGDQVGTIFAAGTSRAFMPHGLGHHLGLEVHDVSPAPHPPLATSEGFEKDAEQRFRSAFAHWKPEWTSVVDTAAIMKLSDFGAGTFSSLHSVDAQVLQPGMVVTVEPGIYFNRYLLDNFFLNDPKHRQFINQKVLRRYMQVGGVRIEDDILITKHGYENLTTAPKGREMLDTIRKGAKGA
ncbi:Putative peptidase M24, aminopeptidase P, creatinase/Aminopeptidase P/Spt16 [Septoria linicola]|uniref:Xaa-Pro aminopeptidase n=1 Tax=Septoria linicola TaxID=215465 RepID=A0A9Q9EF03_9PEZI|nr:putative peptidase M24, aminopeptidase P, creatinase/Aminopeptidase P/Spt16 [Septoria linicola]USW49321.1 Putative peptidase M24, aminopeptidase P, creatinase/Aminopeptidase P/Spt16 [Septoria linicola]